MTFQIETSLKGLEVSKADQIANRHDVWSIVMILRGCGVLVMDRQTDICDSRVTFAIENWIKNLDWQIKQGILNPELNNQWEGSQI